jgi:hypothetical protein
LKPIAGVPVRQGEKVFTEPRGGSAGVRPFCLRDRFVDITIRLISLQVSPREKTISQARARQALSVQAHYVRLDRSP